MAHLMYLPGLLHASFLLHMLLQVSATHFRGAFMSWLPTSISHQVEINLSISWRRNFSGSTFCDQSIIESGKLIGPDSPGYIMCIEGCADSPVRVANVLVRCTGFSESENWVSGQKKHLFTFPERSTGPFTLNWDGKGWLRSIVHGEDKAWSLLATVDLAMRPDNGRMNSSPQPDMSPLIYLQQGCQYNMTIPIQDPDGDVVRCRWAVGTRECGGICEQVTGVQIIPGTCTLSLEAAQEGHLALALQVEDFISPSSTTPLSSVPLQMLLQMYRTSPGTPCNSPPVIISPTQSPPQCGAPSALQIVARTKDRYTRLQDILVKTPGESEITSVRKSDVFRHGTSEREYHVTVSQKSMQPRQPPVTAFCFTAIDSFHIASEPVCITWIVGPMVTAIDTDKPSRTITLTFSEQITRPNISRFLTLYTETWEELVHYNANLDTQVVLSGNQLRLNMAPGVEMSGCFFLLMQQGVVRGMPPCSAETSAVTQADPIMVYLGGGNIGACRQLPTTTTTMPPDTTSTTPSSTSSTTGGGRTTPGGGGGSSTTPGGNGASSSSTTPGGNGASSSSTTPGGTIPSSSFSVSPFSPTGNTPTADDRGTPGSSTVITPTSLGSTGKDFEYLWLLVIVIGLVLVAAIAIVIAAILKRRKRNQEKQLTRQQRQELYFNSLSSRGVSNGGYSSNPNDVKFRQ